MHFCLSKIFYPKMKVRKTMKKTKSVILILLILLLSLISVFIWFVNLPPKVGEELIEEPVSIWK